MRAHRRSLPSDVSADYYSADHIGNFAVEVDLAHVGEYDAALLDMLLSRPGHILPPFEIAAADALRTLLYDMRRSESNSSDNGGDRSANVAIDPSGPDVGEGGEEGDQPRQFQIARKSVDQQLYEYLGTSIQILLRGNIKPTLLRQINANHMNRLIRCPGIIVSASRIQNRASVLKLRCQGCFDTYTMHTTGPFSGASLPTQCRSKAATKTKECGPSPYIIYPDECIFVDQQTLKLQECPECVPTGEMPRSVLLAADRHLVDVAPPGTRVSVIGIVSLFKALPNGSNKGKKSSVRTVYLRVVGMQRDDAKASGDSSTYFSPREEEAFRALSRRSDIYSILSRSIAPSISGSYTIDIKKAIACMLFGGSRKKLPDGMSLRGDINVLLLGKSLSGVRLNVNNCPTSCFFPTSI